MQAQNQPVESAVTGVARSMLVVKGIQYRKSLIFILKQIGDSPFW